jgi:ribosomal protein L11
MTIVVTLPANVPVGTKIEIKSTKKVEIIINYPSVMTYLLRKLDDNSAEIIALENKNDKTGEIEYRKLLDEKG